jgi:exonuclease III
MGMRFLFWNVKKKPVGPLLSRIVEAHIVDVVILAECHDAGVVLSDLNRASGNQFHLPVSPQCRVVIYTRFLRKYVETAHSEDFFTVRLISLPETKPILLAALHLPSKLHKTDSQEYQSFVASQVSEKIRKVELKLGTSRTVLVGDLNMNPFEKGVASANGLHSVMTRDIARSGKGRRKVVREFYPFFYNPMWGRFGDTTEGPPGTYYRRGSEPTEYFWNTYDQVLIRPDLLDSFDEKSVKVLTEFGGLRFLRRSGIPDQSRVSDHLPLLFALTP